MRLIKKTLEDDGARQELQIIPRKMFTPLSRLADLHLQCLYIPLTALYKYWVGAGPAPTRCCPSPKNELVAVKAQSSNRRLAAPTKVYINPDASI